MRRVAIALAVLVVALVAPAARAMASAPDPASAEADFLMRINQLRVGKGLPALRPDASMAAIARRWAGAMAAADRISHNPRLSREVTVDWEKIGENVGVGMTVERLHDAFVASPSHYKNLVDPDFTHIGIAVVVGKGGALFTAHEFLQYRSGGPASHAAPATPASTSTTIAHQLAPQLAAPLALSGVPTPRLLAVLALLHDLDHS